jgi:hypothetical protein
MILFALTHMGCKKSDGSSFVLPPPGDGTEERTVEFVCSISADADLMGVAYRIDNQTTSESPTTRLWSKTIALPPGTDLMLTCSGASTARKVITVTATINVDSVKWQTSSATAEYTVKTSCGGLLP